MVDRPLVVLGFDGSDAAAHAIAATARIVPGAEVLVVCVYRPLPPDGAALLGAPAGMVRAGTRHLDHERRAEAERTAARGAALAAERGCRSRSIAVASHGAVWAALDHVAARDGAVALVVGARGRSAIGRLVLGSVSEGLVHHAACPVLVVPEDRLGDRRLDNAAAGAEASTPS